MATITYKLKCMDCSLHFQVHSWHNDWAEEAAKIFCPECGSAGGKVIWKSVPTKEQIYELVPGASDLLEIR